MQTKIKLLVKIFLILFGISYFGGIGVYLILFQISKLILGQPYVFGIFIRMFLYHYEHPFQYLFVVSIVYSTLTIFWIPLIDIHKMNKWKIIGQIILLFILILIVSSFIGGILWKYHDMKAGYFPENPKLLDDFIWGAKTGVIMGPIIVLLSIPLNIISIITGFFVTFKMNAYYYKKLKINQNTK